MDPNDFENRMKRLAVECCESSTFSAIKGSHKYKLVYILLVLKHIDECWYYKDVVYRHIFQFYNKNFKPSQYPKLYATILAQYVSQLRIGFENVGQWVNNSMRYYQLRFLDYNNKKQQKNTEWKFIDKYIFPNQTNIETLFSHFSLIMCSFSNPMSNKREVDGGSDYIFTLSKAVLVHEQSFSLDRIGWWEVMTLILSLLMKIVTIKIDNLSPKKANMLNSMLNVCCCHIFKDNNNLATKNNHAISQFDLKLLICQRLITFYIACQFDEKRMLIAMKYVNFALKRITYPAPTDKSGHLFELTNSYAFMSYFFILGDWKKFKEYSNSRQAIINRTGLREKTTYGFDLGLDMIARNKSQFDILCQKNQQMRIQLA